MNKSVFIATITIGLLLSAPIMSIAEVVQVIPLNLIIEEKIIKTEDIEVVGVNKDVVQKLIDKQLDEATYEDISNLVLDLCEEDKDVLTNSVIKSKRINKEILGFNSIGINPNETTLRYIYTGETDNNKDKKINKEDILEIYGLLLEDKSIFLNETPSINYVIDIEESKMYESVSKQELLEYHKSFVALLKANTNVEKKMYSKLLK